MQVAMQFISLILVCLPIIVHSGEGPGISACIWNGDTGTYCKMTQITADKIPDPCTSVIFAGIVADTTNNITFEMNTQGGFLSSLLEYKKRVFVHYSSSDYEPGWVYKFWCTPEQISANAQCEMDSLKAFLEPYTGLAGLILDSLDPGIFSVQDYPEPTASFIAYLEVMKTAFPDLSIGMNIPADYLMKYYDSPKDVSEKGIWFDFTKLESYIDFYLLNLFGTAQCTPDLKCVGGYPLTGNYTYTAEKAMGFLAQVKIPTEKCLIQYDIGAVTPGGAKTDFCKMYANTWCTSPEQFQDYCIDTQASLVEKGKFAAEKAGGFVLANIEVDDPAGDCGCSRSFPAFMALLDGFNGIDTVEPCPKYDLLAP